jgi:excinuclease ABC subunit C
LRDENNQNNLVVQVMMIRQGNVWGSSSHRPKQAEEQSLGLVLSAFIVHYYTGKDIPHRLMTNIPCEEEESIKEWLSHQTGRKTSLTQPQRGQGKQWLELTFNNANHALQLQNRANETGKRLLSALQERFNLPCLPLRIEGFDISHLQGTDTVASQVVFIDAEADNKQYRRFNITGISPGDDPAAMNQVIKRRLIRAQQEAVFPDLLLVDGGRTQLKQAEAVLEEQGLIGKVTLLAMAKGQGRKAGLETYYRHSQEEQGIQLAEDDPIAHLLQRIRDEAHRFALSGQKQKRKARQLNRKKPTNTV